MHNRHLRYRIRSAATHGNHRPARFQGVRVDASPPLEPLAGRRREVTEISLPGHHVPLTNSHFWTPRWTPWGVHIVNPPRTLLLSMQITEADHGDEFDKVCWVEGAVVFTKQSNVGVSIEVPVVGEYFAFALGREEDQVR